MTLDHATIAPATPARPVERILVVDDDADINRLLRARLNARGYKTETAGDGIEALAQIDAFDPDVVFLDVSMPGMNGLDVLDRVRQQGRDLAIVMTTAFGSEQVAIDALRRGADDYLRKPFEASEFQAVLERNVARLELRRQNAQLRAELDEQRRQLEAELKRAAEVQAELLPDHPPAMAGFEIAARCVPAREVGGDFYDWLTPSPDLFSFSLGDAMGKGMPAALLMATVRAALRAVSAMNPPGATLDILAKALQHDFARSGNYMTLFHARLNVETRRLYYVDAGHGYAFLRRASGQVEELKSGGLPLGLFPDQTYQAGITTLQPGDVLVVFSDGLTDAIPDGGSDRLRVAEYLAGLTGAQEIVDQLVRYATLTGAPPDDVTVLALSCRASE